MNELISIIVPIYNTECFIRKCIDSIINQTYKNFELILVNDGSTDNSGLICDEYAKKDNRIKVFYKQNGGVSSARNLGLRNCIGKWVTFIDSDDFISLNYLTNLLSNISGEQIVLSGYKSYNKSGRLIMQSEYKTVSFSVSTKQIYLLDSLLLYGTPWGKLFRNEIIQANHIRFDERLSLHEDHLFFFTYLQYTKKIGVKNDRDYFYIDHEDGKSLSRRMIVPYESKFLAYILLKESLKSLMIAWSINIADYSKVKNFIIRLYIGSVIMAYTTKTSKKERLELFSKMNREEILYNYLPLSFRGKIIKFVLLRFPICIKDFVLRNCIRNSLST
jgi:glycosyltransferase involved in cell wall biosynthesis